MQRFVRALGYVALLVTPALLLGSALAAPERVSVVSVGIGGGLTLVGAVTATIERPGTLDRLDSTVVERDDGADALAVAAAAGVTYVLSVHAGLGPVLASALVGVVAGLGRPSQAAGAYCGSFVGMVSPAVFPSVGPVVVAGSVAGVAFVAATESFDGFGGKLGTLALFGCLTTGLLTGVEYGTVAGGQWNRVVLTVPTAAGAAVVTTVLSSRDTFDAVLGSALVGLAAGLVLPVATPAVGEHLATVAFCASFVGMSTRERVGGVLGMVIAGALCGLVFVVVAPAFVGAGGKLGTTAFISCVAFAGADRLVASFGDRLSVAV